MPGVSRSSIPPSSSALCPACKKPVDTLRAGHVAILDGAFRYFCDAECKSAWAQTSKVLEAMTAEPPAVISSGVRASSPALPVVEPTQPVFPPPPPPAAPAADEVEEERPPATMRSAEPEEQEEEPAADAAPLASSAAPDVDEARTTEIAPIVGVLAGVLAAVVSIAGEAASAARLPLALVAAVVVLGRRLREPPSVHRWLTAAPVAAGAALGTVSSLLHDAHADRHVSFVGIAAASALVVDVLVQRAWRDVVRSRARVREALAVPAKVVRGEALAEVDADHVKPGEQVVVEAGETIAVDGIVAAGEANVVPWLDSGAVSARAEGDAVVAGAVVSSGTLRVNATFSGPERAWLRLGTPAKLEDAAPLVALVRRLLERGAPLAAVLVGAAVFASNGSWLDVGIAVCGGGFALAVAAAMSAAALVHARGHVTAQRHGIVYKDAAAFDAAGRADVAVVCSRGTILLGEPEIVAVEAISKDGVRGAPSGRDVTQEDGDDVARMLAFAAGAEMASTHPFAAAILREARARGVRPENVRSALGHSGLGVTALAGNGDRVIVGSRAFLLQEKVSVAIADQRTSALEAEGRSVLLVAVGGRLVGLLALQDGLRPGARAAVQRLHDARIEPVLLSGEARDTSETIARSLEIEHVRPEVLPAERGAEVRALADGGRVVAALGHASTDDGALGAADVSVAMRAAGAAPGEWGVALASDDVRDAALSLTIPRASRDAARTALGIGGAAQAAATLGLAFNVLPAAVAPVFGVLAAAAGLAVVRGAALPSGVGGRD